MFRGSFETKIDEKGRVSVPVKFRDELATSGDDRLVVTNLGIDEARCLEAWPYPEWLKLEARIDERNDWSADAMDYYRNFYLAGAHECQLDGQGRLLIPPTLREYARFVKDIMFAGAGARFRVWDKPQWQMVHAASEQLGATARGVRNELGL